MRTIFVLQKKKLMMRLLPLLLGAILFTGSRGWLEVSNIECAFNSWVEGDGATGFQGRITITVHQDTTGGWEMHLNFDSDVQNVVPYSHATVKQEVDARHYILQNVDYTEDMFVSESPYVFEYGARVYGQIPGCSACFDGSCASTTTSGPTGSTTAGPTTTGGPSGWEYDYYDVLHKSILFFEAQRSGDLPDDNRIDWRGDSALNDGQDVGVDLTGGWYDAGDHVKFGFPMAASVTVLAWGLDAFWDAYDQAGQLDWGLDCIKWPLDYFIKAHVSATKFYGQLGNGAVDHAYWGRPEDMTMERPSYFIDENNGGTDLAGETAAAMAASSLVFRRYGNTDYADTLLSHARELYDFAYNHRAIYSESIPDAANYYNSWSGYNDR